jgi:hypothetical protein
MMTQQEKDWVIKVQVSHLVSDLPDEDDFYYAVFTALSKQSQKKDADTKEGDHDKAGESAGYKNMQRHIQRIAEEAKRRPKIERGKCHCVVYNRSSDIRCIAALEGTLGKVVSNSVRNPKQLIKVSQSDQDSVASDSVTCPRFTHATCR